MNQRIQQLVEQATETIDISAKLGMPGTDQIFNKEKFAELILLDVYDILAGYRGKVIWLNEDTGHNHPIYEIQKHFGIKQ